MARRSYRSRQNVTSNAGEKLHNIAERDITLAVLLTLLGLLFHDGPERGWPFAWLIMGGHISVPSLLASVILILCFIIAIEVITAIVKASEPSADRKYASSVARVDLRQNEDTASVSDSSGTDLSVFEVGNMPEQKKPLWTLNQAAG